MNNWRNWWGFWVNGIVECMVMIFRLLFCGVIDILMELSGRVKLRVVVVCVLICMLLWVMCWVYWIVG